MRSSPDSPPLPVAAVPRPTATGTATSTRERLLEVIAHRGPAHRAELARVLEVSRTTVSKTVNELLEDGLLLVIDEDEALAPDAESPVRLKRKLGLNPQRALLAAAIFRTDRFEVALGTADGRLLAARGELVDHDTPGTERLERARRVFRTLLSEGSLPIEAVRGFYLALDAQVDEHTGEVLSDKASVVWFGTNAKRTVERWVEGAVVLVDNSARLATLTEYLDLPAPRPRCLVYVELGWGIGMGVVKDGMRFTGGHGGAGEIGHTSLDHRGELCGCGNRGCLQNCIGIRAVLARARAALGEEVHSLEDIGERAAGDDPAARALVGEIGEELGAGLVTVCNLLDPDLIVVGGALVGLGPGLIDAAERIMRHRALPLATRTLTVRRSSDREDQHSTARAALWALRAQAMPGLT